MTKWSGGLIDWIENDTAYLSVVFSWQLAKTYQRAIWYKSLGYKVVAGGPAVLYNPQYLKSVALVRNSMDGVLEKHNPDATFTTRGCIRQCPFCIVPKIEGDFVELDDWKIKPIVCDNNFLASSKFHFDSVIDKLKSIKGIDFNQGLDARLLNNYHANRLSELDLYCVRLAWDNAKIENKVLGSLQLLMDAGIPKNKLRVYCLIGFKDTPEDALYRLETLKNLGIWVSPMRYQPLDSIKRNQYIGEYWTERELKDYVRYWSKQRFLGHIPFKDYKSHRIYHEYSSERLI